MLTLYDYNKAPSPQRARIFLAEKEASYNNIQIDLRSGEQFSAEFRQINPRCTVPALLTEEGDIISENIAIAAYLEARFPKPALMGTTPREKAQIMEWNARCEFDGLLAIAEILRNTSPHMKDRAMTGSKKFVQIPELAERGRARIAHFYEDMDARLSSNPYLAGDSFSFADITGFVLINFSKWVKASPDEAFTNLHKWHERLAARPAMTL